MQTEITPSRGWDVVVAGSLLTRLPLPQAPARAFDTPARAVWAYPLVGAALGALAGMFAVVLMLLGLPAWAAAGGLLGALMLMTGAMHEDGLGDTADGLWGGWTPERRLEIMKDSQIGSYGVLALIVVTGLRWGAYAALLSAGPGPVIAAAALSRGGMPLVMATLPHARASGLSHGVGRPDAGTAGVAAALGAGIALIALGMPGIIAAAAGLMTTLGVALVARAKIGGQTGDILGAVQQLSETAALMTLLALLT